MTLTCPRIHVFADLQPYICTFPSCKKGLAKFPTRKMWADHEFDVHRVSHSWNCSECSEAFNDAQALEAHLRFHHGDLVRTSEVSSMVKRAEKKVSLPIETQQCPLCKIIPGKSRRKFINHVSRHMEAIALAVLPRDAPEDSEHGSSVATLDTEDGMGHLEIKELGSPDPYFFRPLKHSPHTPLLMERELQHLEQKLSDPTDERKCICLNGPPGSGKARLMEYYICRNCTQYTGGIFWINYRSRSEISRSLWYIVRTYMEILVHEKQDMTFEQLMRTVEAWFDSRSNWLVILNDLPKDWESISGQSNQLTPIFYPHGCQSSLIYIASHDNIAKLPSKSNVMEIDPVQVADEFSPFMAHIADSDKNLTMGVLPPVIKSPCPSMHESPYYWSVPSITHGDHVPLDRYEKELRLLDLNLFCSKREQGITSVQVSGRPSYLISHLVRYYIDQNRSRFPGGIFWIDVKTPEGYHQCLWRIGMMVGEYSKNAEAMPTVDLVEKISNWLKQRTEWLLVIDMLHTIDDAESGTWPWSVMQIWPNSLRSSIIYMSINVMTGLPFSPFPVEITLWGNERRTDSSDCGPSSGTYARTTNQELFDENTSRLMQSLLCEYPGCNHMFASISDYT